MGCLLSIFKVPHLYNIPTFYFEFSKLSLFTFTTGDGTIIGLSSLTVLLFVMAVLLHLLLRFTMIGRGIYAIGGSIEAAKRAGFNILFIQLFIYAFIGFTAGLASIEYVAMFRIVHPFNMMNMLAQCHCSGRVGWDELHRRVRHSHRDPARRMDDLL